MTSVGTYLRELRERRGVPLAEIARTTRVAQRYLESLEADDHGKLPAPVFTRGYVRAYCQALGAAPDEALACYDGRDGRTPASVAARPAPVARAGETRSRSTVVASLVLLVVLGMALFSVALVIQPRDRAERLTGEPRPEPRPAPAPAAAPTTPEPAAAPPVAVAPPAPSPPASPPIATVPAPSTPPPAPPTTAAPARSVSPVTPPAVAAPAAPVSITPPSPPPAAPTTPVATSPASPVRPLTGLAQSPAPPAVGAAAPAPGTAQASPPRPAPTATASAMASLESVASGVVSPYRLVARTNEATWIRVRTEDGRSSEENVPAGEVREWISDRPFVITVGNAGGVSLELNGRTLPPLGGRGTVIPRLVLPPDNR
jgi:cytoskeleton protein RodZ